MVSTQETLPNPLLPGTLRSTETLTYISKHILKTLLFHVYTFLQKIFQSLWLSIVYQDFISPMSTQCILMKYRILHTTPLQPSWQLLGVMWIFFLRLNSLSGFRTLSPDQHLLHLKNVTNLGFLLIANAANYNFKFSGIGHSLPRSDLICLAPGNRETHCLYGVLLKPT